MLLKHIRESSDINSLLSDENLVNEMRSGLKEGDVYIIRRAFEKEWLLQLRNYLSDIGRSSLPNYLPILANAPNFHRICGDERSYVKGKFHQWSFFPWNQDLFELFRHFRSVYELNNKINGWPLNKYIGMIPEDGCTARLSFQFYPKGAGYIHRHSDVAATHKFTTVSLCMSDKGKDFLSGGLYMAAADGDFDVDAELESGDLLFMHSQIVHGVAPVDPDIPCRWTAFEGKWTLILAVNKIVTNTEIPDSTDYNR